MEENKVEAEKILNAYNFSVRLCQDRGFVAPKLIVTESDKEKFITNIEKLVSEIPETNRGQKQKNKGVDYVGTNISYFVPNELYIYFHLRDLKTEDIDSLNNIQGVKEIILIHATLFNPSIKKKIKEAKVNGLILNPFFIDDIQIHPFETKYLRTSIIKILTTEEKKEFLDKFQAIEKKDKEKINFLPKISLTDFNVRYLGAKRNDIIEITSDSLCLAGTIEKNYRVVKKV